MSWCEVFVCALYIALLCYSGAVLLLFWICFIPGCILSFGVTLEYWGRLIWCGVERTVGFRLGVCVWGLEILIGVFENMLRSCLDWSKDYDLGNVLRCRLLCEWDLGRLRIVWRLGLIWGLTLWLSCVSDWGQSWDSDRNVVVDLKFGFGRIVEFGNGCVMCFAVLFWAGMRSIGGSSDLW